MRILGIVYAVTGGVFFLFPDTVLGTLNSFPQTTGYTEVVPFPADRFWLVMAVAMMAMLSALSFLAAGEPKNRGYPFVHILSKCVSVAGFAYMFLHQRPYFVYLAGIATDLPLAIGVTWIWLRRGELPA